MNRPGKFLKGMWMFMEQVGSFMEDVVRWVLHGMRRIRSLKNAAILGTLTPAFVVPILVLFVIETKAATLEISGVISAKIFRDASTINTVSNWFIVTLDGTNAQIKAGSMGDPAISDFEYGRLNQDSYLLINYTTNLLVTEAYRVENGVAIKVKLAKPQKAENTAMVFINSGSTPEYELGMLSTVWLAYCFHLDLIRSDRNRIGVSPVFSMGSDFRNRGGLADMTYVLEPRTPNFLQSLLESADAKRFETLNLPSPAPDVFTNAIYEVLAWTNIAGLTVPHMFHVTNYHVMGPMGLVDVAKIVFEGVATNFNLTESTLPAFSLPVVTRVLERRSALVAPIGQFSYTTTNGILLTRERLLQHADYIIEKSEFSSPRRSYGAYLRRRMTVVAIIGLLPFLAVVVWWFTRKQAGRKL